MLPLSLVLLRVIWLLLASDCAEEEELLRLRLRELDIVEGWLVFGFLVGDVKCDVVCSVS